MAWGVDTAAILLVAAGDNPERIRSEPAWAHLCGVAPLEATSGKVVHRHRLNRGGNRQANHALWRIVFTRMGSDERTRAYVERHLEQGRSKPETMRILKRYVAREIYKHLRARNHVLGSWVWPTTCLTPSGCLSNDLPTRDPNIITRHRHGLIRARPPPEWPITGLPSTAGKPLDKT